MVELTEVRFCELTDIEVTGLSGLELFEMRTGVELVDLWKAHAQNQIWSV